MQSRSICLAVHAALPLGGAHTYSTHALRFTHYGCMCKPPCRRVHPPSSAPLSSALARTLDHKLTNSLNRSCPSDEYIPLSSTPPSNTRARFQIINQRRNCLPCFHRRVHSPQQHATVGPQRPRGHAHLFKRRLLHRVALSRRWPCLQLPCPVCCGNRATTSAIHLPCSLSTPQQRAPSTNNPSQPPLPRSAAPAPSAACTRRAYPPTLCHTPPYHH